MVADQVSLFDSDEENVFTKSPSGATLTCNYCGTMYDNHPEVGEVPPVGDGCDHCSPPIPDEWPEPVDAPPVPQPHDVHRAEFLAGMLGAWMYGDKAVPKAARESLLGLAHRALAEADRIRELRS